jgi:hypothetical protein
MRLLQDTMDTYRGVARSLPPPTRRSITTNIHAAQAAANRGQCAEMHKSAQAARAVLERRLDALLGRGRR